MYERQILKNDVVGYPRKSTLDQNYHEQNVQISRQEIQQRVFGINMKLNGMIKEEIGDVLSDEMQQIQKTLRVIQTLISQVKQSQHSKSKLNTEIHQLQNLNFKSTNLIDKLTQQKATLENDRNTAFQNIKQIDKKYKQLLEKSNKQKQQLSRNIKQMQLRQKSVEAEFRKKQNTLKQYQEHIKKFLQEKQLYRNGFEVLQKFGSEGVNTHGRAEKQYQKLIGKSQEHDYKVFMEENQHLRTQLVKIVEELSQISEFFKNKILKKARNSEYSQQFQELSTIKPETLILPNRFSKDRLKQLHHCLSKVKQLIKFSNFSSDFTSQPKQLCPRNFNTIINNYKQILESQNELLNKVILKSNQFQEININQLQNRYIQMDYRHDQLEKTMNFVEQQEQYFKTRNIELEKKRIMISRTVQKTEQNKRELLRHRD